MSESQERDETPTNWIALSLDSSLKHYCQMLKALTHPHPLLASLIDQSRGKLPPPFVIDLGDLLRWRRIYLARDTVLHPPSTVVTCAIFRTSRNLDQHDRDNGSSNQNLVSYNNRDTQLPEQLSPISAPALPRPCVCTNQ